ncbi:winged helix-turn-helix domain-containing protein [Saccharothrix algeriensis]|uniref:Winged helix-turn-helix domain-containing protein n=1 Tax=Saccharothrix algeriensis TaxID=173560 RepID=A0A8T8HU94_9PSEU|nr:winged helix-turn-helix domain-containing protein [Saccharothrix algeriensis]
MPGGVWGVPGAGRPCAPGGRAGRTAVTTGPGSTGRSRPLEQGPAAHGYTEDRRWTLARVAELVARLFAVRYTPAGMSLVLHRIGYSPQVPARRADRRDEAAVTAWRRESWARGKP